MLLGKGEQNSCITTHSRRLTPSCVCCQTQLARAGVTENMFSLCYGFPEGGSMLLGEGPLAVLKVALHTCLSIMWFVSACLQVGWDSAAVKPLRHGLCCCRQHPLFS